METRCHLLLPASTVQHRCKPTTLQPLLSPTMHCPMQAPPPLPPQYSTELRTLCLKLLSKRAPQRPSADELMKHQVVLKVRCHPCRSSVHRHQDCRSHSGITRPSPAHGHPQHTVISSTQPSPAHSHFQHTAIASTAISSTQPSPTAICNPDPYSMHDSPLRCPPALCPLVPPPMSPCYGRPCNKCSSRRRSLTPSRPYHELPHPLPPLSCLPAPPTMPPVARRAKARRLGQALHGPTHCKQQRWRRRDQYRGTVQVGIGVQWCDQGMRVIVVGCVGDEGMRACAKA